MATVTITVTINWGMTCFESSKKRVALTLFSFLFSCQPCCDHWFLDKTVTCNPCYNSGRLYFSPEDCFDQLELELSRTGSGFRLYVNVRSLPIKSTLPDNRVELKVLIGSEQYSITADRFEGGQRLLISQGDQEMIINALLTDIPVTLTVGRYSSEIEPSNFNKLYHQLIKIP